MTITVNYSRINLMGPTLEKYELDGCTNGISFLKGCKHPSLFNPVNILPVVMSDKPLTSFQVVEKKPVF